MRYLLLLMVMLSSSAFALTDEAACRINAFMQQQMAERRDQRQPKEETAKWASAYYANIAGFQPTPRFDDAMLKLADRLYNDPDWNTETPSQVRRDFLALCLDHVAAEQKTKKKQHK